MQHEPSGFRPMPHDVFDSVDTLVSRAGLSQLLGYAVDAVDTRPLEVEHLSGNSLEQVRVWHDGRVSRFVLKHFHPADDWIMRLTHDHAVREVALFRGGIYRRLPPQCYVPMLAAARNGNAWTSLMVDVSTALERSGAAPIAMVDLQRYVTHLAAMHACFLRDRSLQDPALGLCTLRDFVEILSPARVRRELVSSRTHPVLEAADRGWAVFNDLAPRAAVALVTAVQQDARPLLEALELIPHTLVHGDYKLANLGTLAPSTAHGPAAIDVRTVMLDWQDATRGPPMLDLGYFLAITAARLPIAKERVIGLYRDALVAHGYTPATATWERDVTLGLLAGGALRLLWQKAWATQAADPVVHAHARQELAWWCALVIRARAWLP